MPTQYSRASPTSPTRTALGHRDTTSLRRSLAGSRDRRDSRRGPLLSLRSANGREIAPRLVADAQPIVGGYAINLKVERFAHAVAIEADGFVPDDNYVHVEPGD